jgi:hypothetical protein
MTSQIRREPTRRNADFRRARAMSVQRADELSYRFICGRYDLSRLLLLMMNFCSPVSWYAIFAPTGTPRDVVTRINAETKRSQTPE